LALGRGREHSQDHREAECTFSSSCGRPCAICQGESRDRCLPHDPHRSAVHRFRGPHQHQQPGPPAQTGQEGDAAGPQPLLLVAQHPLAQDPERDRHAEQPAQAELGAQPEAQGLGGTGEGQRAVAEELSLPN